MAIFEKTIRNQNFDTLLRKLEHAIPDSSWSAELEAWKPAAISRRAAPGAACGCLSGTAWWAATALA